MNFEYQKIIIYVYMNHIFLPIYIHAAQLSASLWVVAPFVVSLAVAFVVVTVVVYNCKHWLYAPIMICSTEHPQWGKCMRRMMALHFRLLHRAHTYPWSPGYACEIRPPQLGLTGIDFQRLRIDDLWSWRFSVWSCPCCMRKKRWYMYVCIYI